MGAGGWGERWLLLGNGDGSVREGSVVAQLEGGDAWQSRLVAADADGDGDLDLSGDANGALWFAEGDGRGGFAPTRLLASGLTQPTTVLWGEDYGGDGHPDVAVPDPERFLPWIGAASDLLGGPRPACSPTAGTTRSTR